MDEGITFEDVVALVAVAERGSVSGAAEHLGVAQPVVTRRIQRLEAALGAELLDRSVRPARLTTAGRQALGPSRTILAALAELRSITSDAEPAGELRLGVAPALADLALGAALGELRGRFPRVSLRVTTDWTPQLLHQLRASVLDLAVVQLPADAQPPDGLDARSLGVERLIVAAAPELGVGPEASLAMVAALPWVLSPAGDGGRLLLESALRRLGSSLQVAAEIQGHEHQAALVARGVGLGLLPSRLFRRREGSQRLRPLRLVDAELTIRIWAARGQPQRQLVAPLAFLDDALGKAIERGLLGGVETP